MRPSSGLKIPKYLLSGLFIYLKKIFFRLLRKSLLNPALKYFLYLLMKAFCSLSGNSGELDLFYVSLLSEIELHFIFANFPQISHLKAVVSKRKKTSLLS